ncbi:hypothetical protein BOTBODRAFT_31537 [Botryobasidium botryosum FD-172 SS1]|uniref:Uncharacterized protein n=1 Tax=Botryobasidium botryosum (strain FD-172 SS1) TaxID=930990 RepID=A0A067MLP4_BOTB1|nr:hypothetical protein BOTBODRAFT_31537 [Botryobasidium botryosum FD-172 SS1]
MFPSDTGQRTFRFTSILRRQTPPRTFTSRGHSTDPYISGSRFIQTRPATSVSSRASSQGRPRPLPAPMRSQKS